MVHKLSPTVFSASKMNTTSSSIMRTTGSGMSISLTGHLTMRTC